MCKVEDSITGLYGSSSETAGWRSVGTLLGDGDESRSDEGNSGILYGSTDTDRITAHAKGTKVRVGMKITLGGAGDKGGALLWG